MMNTVLNKNDPAFADKLFGWALTLSLVLLSGVGLMMSRVKSVDIALMRNQVHGLKVMIAAQDPVSEVTAKQPLVRKTEMKSKEPVDLTEKPQLSKTHDDVQKPAEQEKAVRRVYGLRKVYAKGLGAGGSMQDAVVGKLGNTLNKEFDTLTATDEDVKGTVVSTTTVTAPPKFKKVVRPEYTKEMLENRIEGVIKVKALVDIDGKVKKASILNDLGFESASKALKATLSMEFDPAVRGTDPVAVWIVIPIRFIMLS